jgi:PAS domain S-box-containing protein
MQPFEDMSREELIRLLQEHDAAHPSGGADARAMRVSEERLFESKQRLASMVRSAMDAIISIDEKQRICLFNPAAERMFGLPQAETLGTPLARLIPERLRHAHAEHVREFARTGATCRRMGALGEICGLRANGEEFPLEASLSQVSVGGAKVLTVILRDITERQRAEEAQRKADGRKDIFLATLSHELRNPLAVIVSGLEVQRLVGLPEEAVVMRDMMARQAGHLARLVDDLLDVAHITHGTIALRPECLDLAGALQEVLDTHGRCHQHERQITFRAPPQPLIIEADPVRLSQILVNLLGNAVKFSGENSTIAIELAQSGDTAIITVRDNGIGIAAARLPRIFDMFSQAEASGTAGQKGLGIGLALTRGLVELHGGSIEAHSDGPGRGSEFVVHLPLAEAAAEKTLTSRLQPPEASRP